MQQFFEFYVIISNINNLKTGTIELRHVHPLHTLVKFYATQSAVKHIT